MGVVGQVLFQHYTHIMKLIAISALAAFAAAEQMLAGMHADSDECAGCEVAPEPVFKCFGDACSDVECGNMAAIPDEEGNPTATAEATASAAAKTPSTTLATESRLSTRCAQREPSTAWLQWIPRGSCRRHGLC